MTPVYAEGLRRVPTQQRSQRRVEAILAATESLLADHGPEELTVREIADEADVPIGTIYQFFEDKDALFQALARLYIDAMPTVIDEAFERTAATWSAAVDRIVDAYAQMIRERPALRSLWLSGSLSEATRRLEAESDLSISRRIAVALTAYGSRKGSAAQWSSLVALIDGLLHLAFRDDPAGDPEILRETRRAARAYAAKVIEPVG